MTEVPDRLLRKYLRAHPLDAYLLDVVEGRVGADHGGQLARVEEHLKTCSLCRLKAQRLTGGDDG